MPDTKITALTAIGANPIIPATFPIPMVDLTDTSMAASGTTKKVTVNQILGAGGTATLASATINGDLTVDTSTLKVDSANNRVGIGTASPANPFDVVSASGTIALFKRTGSNGAFIGIQDGSGSFSYLGSTNGTFAIQTPGSGYSDKYTIASDGTATWYVGGSTAMTLNSTGLGVGVTPGSGLGNIQAGGSANASLYVQQGTDTVRMGMRATGRTGILLDSSDATYTNRAWYLDNVGSTGSLIIGRQGLDVVTFSNSGNVGIGVTPSAWLTGVKALDIGSSGLAAYSGGITHNAYFDNTDSRWEYKGTGAATFYNPQNGVHQWFVAASGTANNAITTFSSASMTLDASGNLLVGTTSLISGTADGSINIAGANSQQIVIRNTGATAGQFWRQAVDSGNTFYVLNNASTGVSITSGATSWSAVSDERLKDIIEPISNAIAKVGSLRSVIGKYKNDETNTRRSFLIAQDVLSVLPEAVDSSKSNELGLRYSEVIPLLVAAIKELTAEVNALKNA
jgi:hypothetical protein